MRIEHDRSNHRFAAQLNEGEAELVYRKPEERVLDLLHTYVPRHARGDGVGEALVEHAFQHAREGGLRIIPTCPFVRAWLRAHPEEQDLVADS